MMKVPLSVRSAYEEQKEFYENLKRSVDQRIHTKKNPKWHYESRVKSLESYALKLETGRFDDSHDIEDFFACTLVVENHQKLINARDLIEENFLIKSSRPKIINQTHKSSDSFPFDDLRLYVEWIDSGFQKPTGLTGKKFEVQIKTYLQHAWSIATHDLIYKNEEKSWAKERIAYQVKAMLEHAELSIASAETLSQSATLNISDVKTDKICEIIKILKKHWDLERLPRDLVRLSTSTAAILEALDLSTEELDEILDRANQCGRGSKIQNLSPFNIITTSLYEAGKIQTQKLRKKRGKFKIFITEEQEIPESFINDLQSRFLIHKSN